MGAASAPLWMENIRHVLVVDPLSAHSSHASRRQRLARQCREQRTALAEPWAVPIFVADSGNGAPWKQISRNRPFPTMFERLAVAEVPFVAAHVTFPMASADNQRSDERADADNTRRVVYSYLIPRRGVGQNAELFDFRQAWLFPRVLKHRAGAMADSSTITAVQTLYEVHTADDGMAICSSAER